MPSLIETRASEIVISITLILALLIQVNPLAAAPPTLSNFSLGPAILTQGTGTHTVSVSVFVADADGYLNPNNVKAIFKFADGTKEKTTLVDNGEGLYIGEVSIETAVLQDIAVKVKAKDLERNRTKMATVLSIVLPDASSLRFFPAESFRVGTYPIDVLTHDLDGDGNLDVVTADADDRTITVLLGDGEGDFSDPLTFEAGRGSFSVAIGDIDVNGNLDLAVANKDTDNVTILLGDGSLSFSEAIPLDVGESPTSVEMGDLNDDGILDLAIANSGSNTVTVLIGDGDAGFTNAGTFEVNITPRAVAMGDFNGDDKIDLVTADWSSSNVSVLFSQ